VYGSASVDTSGSTRPVVVVPEMTEGVSLTVKLVGSTRLPTIVL
jgi:hypothetical protein